MQIDNQNYEIRFRRQLEPVTFFRRGRQQTQPRMATICEMYTDTGELLGQGRVRLNHRDVYSRRIGNALAFRRLAENFPAMKNHMLQWFFSGSSPRRVQGK